MDRERTQQQFDRLFAATFGGKVGQQQSKDAHPPARCRHQMRTCKKCRPAPRRIEPLCDFPLARTPPDSPKKRPRADQELEHGNYSFSDDDDPSIGRCAPISKTRVPRGACARAPQRANVCEHGKQKARCRACGGSAFCEHDRFKWSCRECGGTQICEHDRRRSECVECGGGGICSHGRRKTRCQLCKCGE